MRMDWVALAQITSSYGLKRYGDDGTSKWHQHVRGFSNSRPWTMQPTPRRCGMGGSEKEVNPFKIKCTPTPSRSREDCLRRLKRAGLTIRTDRNPKRQSLGGSFEQQELLKKQ